MYTIVNSRPVNTPPQTGEHDPRFLEPLILEYIDGHNFRLVDEFDYHTDVKLPFPPDNGKSIIHVPKDFVTDFASVPKALWNVLPPTGQYGKAAVIHDYLYRTPGQATRPEADAVFLEAMTALGVGRWTRETMYWGVRTFGSSSYKGGL